MCLWCAYSSNIPKVLTVGWLISSDKETAGPLRLQFWVCGCHCLPFSWTSLSFIQLCISWGPTEQMRKRVRTPFSLIMRQQEKLVCMCAVCKCVHTLKFVANLWKCITLHSDYLLRDNEVNNKSYEMFFFLKYGLSYSNNVK